MERSSLEPVLRLCRSIALVAALGIVGTLSGVPTPLAAQTDNFSDALAVVRAVYPELAKPDQFHAWFETRVLPVTTIDTKSSYAFSIRVVTAKDMEAILLSVD
jgi:hypothetical protein